MQCEFIESYGGNIFTEIITYLVINAAIDENKVLNYLAVEVTALLPAIFNSNLICQFCFDAVDLIIFFIIVGAVE